MIVSPTTCLVEVSVSRGLVHAGIEIVGVRPLTLAADSLKIFYLGVGLCFVNLS